MPRKRRVTRIGASDEPTRVDGYGRVSTDEQAREGLSLVHQEKQIRRYCELYGLDLVRIVIDPGVSAKTLEREGLSSVLDDLRQGRADGVVILKLDRLTRQLRDWSDLIDEFFSERGGRRLFSVNDSIDTRTPSGRMVLNMIMTVAQWEREEIAYRTSNALQGKISRGERCGRVRFGYKLAPDGKTLLPYPKEQRAIASMRSWRDQGMTYREMVARRAKVDRLVMPGGQFPVLGLEDRVTAQDGVPNGCNESAWFSCSASTQMPPRAGISDELASPRRHQALSRIIFSRPIHHQLRGSHGKQHRTRTQDARWRFWSVGSADGTFPPLGMNGPYDGDRSPAPAGESMTSVHSSPPMGPSPWRRPTVPSSPGRDSGPNGGFRV
jgi:site-specific DNA recombinase